MPSLFLWLSLLSPQWPKLVSWTSWKLYFSFYFFFFFFNNLFSFWITILLVYWDMLAQRGCWQSPRWKLWVFSREWNHAFWQWKVSALIWPLFRQEFIQILTYWPIEKMAFYFYFYYLLFIYLFSFCSLGWENSFWVCLFSSCWITFFPNFLLLLFNLVSYA